MNSIFSETRKLTFLGVMLALTIVFVALTAVPTASATMAFLIFIPTIVTSIIMGPKAGALMGFLSGATTMLRAILAPLSPFDAFFINPLISILPRIFIGITPFLIYKLIKGLIKNETGDKLAILLAGAAGAITNTALVMTMLYIIYAQQVVDMIGVGFKIFLISIITTNALIEAVVAAILTVPAVIAYRKISKQ
ncbi:MAG: ECF transporter S component [Bacillota bacterium]|nr:ECF transporter S component [Bacillota bacterium]